MLAKLEEASERICPSEHPDVYDVIESLRVRVGRDICTYRCCDKTNTKPLKECPRCKTNNEVAIYHNYVCHHCEVQYT
jgi:hypothetical protein